jgi:phenylalanyl-tRNA synthetase alpha chain
MPTMNDLDQLLERARSDFASAGAPADLENAKARFLGKSGALTELLKGLGALPPEQKKTRGAEINLAKQRIETLLSERRGALAEAELQAQLEAEALDVSLPGRQRGSGGLHPVSRTLERIEAIFGSMGFDVADGPEIEEDWFNFTALTHRPTIRRGRCTTPSMSTPSQPTAAAICCARTPARCRSATRGCTSRRSR